MDDGSAIDVSYFTLCNSLYLLQCDVTDDESIKFVFAMTKEVVKLSLIETNYSLSLSVSFRRDL